MTSIVMIVVTDDSGKQWNINLNYIEVIQFPSLQANIQQNLNVEKIVMQGGEIIRLPVGTWQTALDALYAEFNANPQPMPNIKDKIFIMPQA